MSELAVLLAHIANGDAVALQRFYDRTAARVFGIIVCILPAQKEAEDVLQEVYLTVWRKASDYDAERFSPVTWTIIMARSRAIDRLRARDDRQLRSHEQPTADRDWLSGGDTAVQLGTYVGSGQSALASLDPCHATVIRDCYLRGLTYDTLAEFEGVPLSEIKNRARSGLLRLRAQSSQSTRQVQR